MNSTVSILDSAERKRVLDPGYSFIVQAPAGSGKTGLLIQRYLMLLAHVKEPEEIVVITFTKKAVAEIRERVLTTLTQVNKVPETEHEKLIYGLAEKVLQRDTQAGWQIVNNPTRLRIQTIDSLCALLARQMPILSEFCFQFECTEDASELYLEAARATIDLDKKNNETIQNLKRLQDVERLLEHLDNNVSRTEKLLSGILEQRDHWLRHINKINDREKLETALRSVRREVLKRVANIYPKSMEDELMRITDYAATNLKESGSNLPLTTCTKLSKFPGCEEQDVSHWHGIAEMLTTKNGCWRTTLRKADGFPPGATKEEKKKSKLWKDRVFSLIEKLKEEDKLLKWLHNLRNLPPPTYTNTQWEVLGSITRLLPYAVAQLKLIFKARGKVDFTEVSQGALQALGESDAPTDLALTLDYRIQHLLIDEFQDTSISQYELITQLTAGWEEGDGRTLFAVGDPMQSIYRFREAEVGLFLRARSEGIGNVPLESIVLQTNFRSQQNIVKWVNETFSQIMPVREADISAGAISYTGSVSAHKEEVGKAVSIHPFFNGDHAAEARKVVDIVLQIRCEDPSSTIAILGRTRASFNKVIPQLKEVGLRYRAIGIEELGCRPVVQDLLVLTRALVHLEDRIAWLSVLRAPWCGLMLNDLNTLFSTKTTDISYIENEGENSNSIKGNHHTVWELINDDVRLSAVSSDGVTRLQRIRKVLGNCVNNRNRQFLRTTVEAAWLALGGAACVNNETDLEDAEIYLDYLEVYERNRSIYELASFEKGLTKLYALPDTEADNTLQLMTIHKAKGLEFDYVIVPGLGRSVRSNEKKLFMWMERPYVLDNKENTHTDLLLAPIQKTGTSSDLIYPWLEKLDSEKEYFEDERLLYVAATRTKKYLHLLGNTTLTFDTNDVSELKRPPKKSLLNKLWPVVEPIFAKISAQVRSPNYGNKVKEDEKNSIDQSLRRLAADWTFPSAPSGVKWRQSPEKISRHEIEFSWAGETARHIGNIVHRWLQNIAEDGVKKWDKCRIEGLHSIFKQNLIVCGMSGNNDEIEIAVSRIKLALTHAVHDTRGRWLLGPHENAQNELHMTSIFDGEPISLVIDRTFISTDGTRWIVDYKTSSHGGTDVGFFLDRERERYSIQLNRYAAMMRKIDTRPIKLGLYFPLLKGWREWMYEV